MNKKKTIIGLLAIMAISFAQGCRLFDALGQNPEGAALKQIEKLPNYRNGAFHNLEGDDSVKVNGFKALKSMLSRSETVSPFNQLPSFTTDLKSLTFTAPTLIWFGHSSVLIKSKVGNILIDPIFSKNAGPVPGMVKAFRGSTTYRSSDMPAIDVLIISHDHYDHLDYKTVLQLKDKFKAIVVPIGVGSHFIKWGFDPKRITELNWNESTQTENKIAITATPAKHRSNRTLAVDKTLWASYVIKIDGYSIFYSGDGGYGKHFKQIGKQYGPFDLALLECGQYSPNWPSHHMTPEQTAQAAQDLQTQIVQPVHWAKFAESDHPWNEPVKRLLSAAKNYGYEVNIPEIGQPFTLGQPVKKTVWWNFESQ